jgi:hypothetical protein
VKLGSRYGRVSSSDAILIGAALAALSVGAAIVGVAGSQSPGAVLQRAAASTMNSSSLEFRGVTRYQLFGHGGSASTLQTETTTGRYRSPNKWVIVYSTGQSRLTYVWVGDNEYLPARPGHWIRSPLSDPLTTAVGVIQGFVPPLALMLNVSHVTHRGDFFTFFIPSVPLPFGWTGSPPKNPPPPKVAKDVFATATLRGGYVWSLSFPRGVSGAGEKLPPMAWWINNVDLAPNVAVPLG